MKYFLSYISKSVRRELTFLVECINIPTRGVTSFYFESLKTQDFSAQDLFYKELVRTTIQSVIMIVFPSFSGGMSFSKPTQAQLPWLLESSCTPMGLGRFRESIPWCLCVYVCVV